MNTLIPEQADLAPATRLHWPLPAALAWLAGWGVMFAWPLHALPGWLVLVAAWAPSWAMAAATRGRWRRLILVSGLPFAAALTGAAEQLSSWVWLVGAIGIVAIYPLSAWRDAPVFPTPAGALTGLAPMLCLPEDAYILDAGSGLGHGLRALRRAFPRARVVGIERSVTLATISRVVPGTPSVACGDMWSGDWSAFDAVYLFQRPESMCRAWAKACAEMREGAWLVSLDFEVPGRPPDVVSFASPGRARAVQAYRIPGHASREQADARAVPTGR